MSTNYVRGYTLKFATTHPYHSQRTHELPKGWRWLKVGEAIRRGDVSCDPRILPVRITQGDGTVTEESHPIRTRRKNQ